MYRVIVERLVSFALALVAVTLAGFLLIYLAPSDPATVAAARRINGPPPVELVAAVRREMGLDRPIPLQYLRWLGGLLRGDLGTSTSSGGPVLHEFTARLPATLVLAASATVVSVTVGLGWAGRAAARIGGPADWALRSWSLAAGAVPDFVLAFGLIVLFAVKLDWLPVYGASGLSALVLPTLTLAWARTVVMGRYGRVELGEGLAAPHVRTARALGLRDRSVWSHAVLRARGPRLITLVGAQFASMATGSVIVERIFAWPGIGNFYVDAIAERDLPVIQAGLVFFAVLYLGVNLVADLCASLLSPWHALGDLGN